MKKINFKFLFLCSSMMVSGVYAQTVSGFENITLPADSFKNGIDRLGGFISGNAFFVNHFDSVYSSWDGFAISNKKDTSTAGYLNQYSSVTGSGYASSNYATAYYNGFDAVRIRLTGIAVGKQVSGFYVTNSTYAYFAMKNGSSFNKKFGGSSGNDPDWFKLSVRGYVKGKVSDNIVDFYLSDLRPTDNSKDYIIKKWTWISLLKLGNVDSLELTMSSSDTAGGFGMNNPAYFCLDNFTTGDVFSGIDENLTDETNFAIYPNPAQTAISIQFEAQNAKVEVINSMGVNCLTKSVNRGELIDVSSLSSGIYNIIVMQNEIVKHQKLVIE